MRSAFDILIVGSGMAGLATAWYLRAIGHNGSIALIERDPSFAHGTNTIPGAVIRQQFRQPENRAMARHGAQFLKTFDTILAKRHVQNASLNFQEYGLLNLVKQAHLDMYRSQIADQQAHATDVAFLTPELLKHHFSWANFDDVAGGALGLSNEGWFDPDVLHSVLRLAVRDENVTLIKGAVTEIDHQPTRIDGVVLDNGRRLACGHLVNATGSSAGVFARLAKINLPIAAKSECLFIVHGGDCPNEMPLVMDPTGVFIRPEAGLHVCGITTHVPSDATEPDMDPAMAAETQFKDHIHPVLTHRIPGFAKAKLVRIWQGRLDYNRFDGAPIIGAHPVLPNFYAISGFGRDGIQQAPAAGRAIAELIYHGAYQTIDLTRFGFERLLDKSPLQEVSLV